MPRIRLSAMLRRGMIVVAAVSSLLVAGVAPPAVAGDSVVKIRSTVLGSDGERYSVTNHLTRHAFLSGHQRREWLLVWAGDTAAGNPDSPDPDFLAVVDATPSSRSYGKVVNTVTLDSTFGNEPHHMQYVWHKGDRVYAGGLMTDTTYVFDVSRLPRISLAGITLPTDTPCGSIPDAYAVLRDGTAYATYMGGPDVTGPCTYSNGEVRVGNGFGGSPGELVRLDRRGRVLAEVPAATTGPERPSCLNLPALPAPTCANPHGIGVREDLNRVITSDFAEVRNLVNTDVPPDPDVLRDTLRVFDISNRNIPRLVSVSAVPDGPRQEPHPVVEEYRATMETAVTHQRHHRGAFASTMGGAVYYTPDITDPTPTWREVFDDTTAFASLFPDNPPSAGGDVGSWLQVSPDDRFLYHVVLGGGPFTTSPYENAGMVYVLDIQPLLRAGNRAKCSVDTLEEVTGGGAERDCPRLVSALPIMDSTSGGPHWASLDTFALGRDGFYRETSHVSRLAFAKYFVAAAQIDGDHRVCMVDVNRHGQLSLDEDFRDEHDGATCLGFDRTRWPHGTRGGAQPHGVLFAINDRDIR